MAPPAHGRADRETEGAGGSPSPGPDLADTETPVRERSAEKYQTPRTEMALSSIFGTCPALAGAVLAKRRQNLLQASGGTSTYPPSACDRQSAKWWTPLNSEIPKFRISNSYLCSRGAACAGSYPRTPTRPVRTPTDGDACKANGVRPESDTRLCWRVSGQ